MSTSIDAPTAVKQNNGVGLAALITGAVALLFAIIPILSFIAWVPSIAAIVLGIVGLVLKNRKRAFAWTGLGLGVVAWLVAIFVSLASLAGAASAISEGIESGSPLVSESAVSEPVEKAPIEEAAPVESVEPAPAAPQYTTGQQNAIAKAQSYLQLTAFSRTGLIDQLVFEGFSNEDAAFAVDTIAPDWTAQAVAKGKSYMELTAFSRQGLIDQLVFDGFTTAEAEAGAAGNGY